MTLCKTIASMLHDEKYEEQEKPTKRPTGRLTADLSETAQALLVLHYTSSLILPQHNLHIVHV